MQVSPPAVTEMVKRMISENLLIKDSSTAICSPSSALQTVSDLFRKHRLIEVFLLKKLGYTTEEVHEEAEVLDEDSCCVLESLLGMNAPVSGDLEGQLLVVSLLLYTIVLREVLDITDRRIDRVDSDRLQLILLSRVDQLLISGDVTTPLVDGELDSKGIRLIDVADDQLGIEDFEGK